MKKKIMIATLAILAFGLLLRSFTRPNDDSQAGEVVEATRADLVITVEASGNLESTNSLIISPPRIPDTWRYTIAFIAPEGKEVKQGTPVLGFDAKKLQDQLVLVQSSLASDNKKMEIIKLEEQEKLENVELELAESRVELSKAHRKLDTPEDLITHNELKQIHLDAKLLEIKTRAAERKLSRQKENMKTRIEGQQRKMERARNREKRLISSIEKMTIKAPKDGLLVYKTKWNGDKYTVGENVWQGSNLLEIPDLHGMRVAGVVSEPDAGKVAVGQSVEIRLDANPDKLFKGEIQSLGRIFRRKSHKKPTIVFDAVISIENPDPELMRPGMAAQLTIQSSLLPNVLQIPKKAARLDAKGHYVLIPGEWGKPRRIQVVLGKRAGEMVEVKQGLKEGDQILLSAPEKS